MPIVSNVNEVDVVVVGAGITGLSTAYAVQKSGCSVLVVEAANDVGGRIMTRERNGDLVEVGQQYFLSSYSESLKLLEEIGMTSQLVEENPGPTQYIDKKGRSRLVESKADLLRVLGVRGVIDLARATLQYSTLGKPLAKYGLEPYVEAYDNAVAEEALSWAGENFMNYVVRPMVYGNGGTSLEHSSLFQTIRLFRGNLDGATHYGFRGGNRALPRKLAEYVPVMLNAEVSELLTAGDAVTGVKLADGRTIEAGHVILCTTPNVAARLTPSMFGRAKAFLSNFNHTRLALVFFYLDRPVKSAGVSFGTPYPGKRYFNLSINHTVMRPFQVPSGKAIISAWSAYPDAVGLLEKSDDEIHAMAFEEMKLFYPGLSKDWVEHSEVVRHNWGYARPAVGDARRLLDFRADAETYKGLSYANADYNLVALESGVIMGKQAAARAVKSLREPA
ncbi:protoporphyrinogen/coproporphyrinogen oxidase [Paraburkholderia pallida]|uniref:FAD-dependent oxidoreductase n=1 Tax=Paraburkholderia pallida TaxID=2547399 RepID=A0A4P7D5G6_9BURK|nr:FAD-dependent oxidoreductase [Paraburkholderia pallida]QBR03959.1 FAD-dependent oxidoreductase [Paraburkholderia pallida]